MIPTLRKAYNDGYTAERYGEYARRLSERGGQPIPFRLAETPVFLPPELRDEMVEASLEIFRQLSTPQALHRSLAAVPARFNVPGSDDLPVFAVTDFAVVRDASGRLAPRLIELQAFPTLYAFQVAQCEEISRICPGGESLDWYLSGLDAESYRRAVGDAILSGLPPANVILLDLDPPRQKTAVDFAFTEQFWGVRALDPSQIEKRGRELYYDNDGKRTRIHRIYNRLIFDELEASGARLPFDLTSRIDVSWAGHPNWYFRWSKHCLPGLRHPTVPEAHFLSDLSEPPSDLENWVLKPLFSFAGSGVKVDVTPADLAAVPDDQRAQTLLMRKIEYAPAIPTVDGHASKVEVRVMFVWKNEAPFPVISLARLSQGKMMGVNYNKDRTWVGSSANLWPKDRGAAPTS
ncbi:MAG TPA: hypothetical protein VH854_07615 [Thermoanaerobaculia bacterium]|jgi:hypothetical protein|nr:hypothetical protein [Thermoanaerobaculia bacterium]